jgi:adenylate kinase
MPRIILMGPPGSGKGTQGDLLAEGWQVPRISPGDIFRAEIKKGSALGKEVVAFSNVGKLVPDSVVIDVIRDRLNEPDAKLGWILDGFPRTIPQAEALDQLLANINQVYDRVINLEVPDQILVARLLNRAKESGRADDTAEVIEQRLQEYYAKTRPLLDFYGEKVVQIDGTKTVEEVTTQILSGFPSV